jgi:hypothetical protein
VLVANVVDEERVGEAELAAQRAGERHVVPRRDALLWPVVLRKVALGYEALHRVAGLVAAGHHLRRETSLEETRAE